MRTRLLTIATVTAFAVTTATAQTYPRRADIRGGGEPGSGKCTVEVVVDGAAQVEIRGDGAILRDLKGQPPQWRRFECTGVMPARPVDFRFQGVNGRGSQQLTADPRNGGPAVVQIEDPENGADSYVFDIFWSSNGPRPGPETRNQPDFDRFGRGGGPSPAALQNCQRAVQDRVRRDGFDRVEFGSARVDDQPGRNDWLIGDFRATGQYGPETFRFSCSVDMRDGDVRSVDVTTQHRGERPEAANPQAAAIQNCERSVQEKLGRDGYNEVNFGQLRVDDQPGRNDWVVGDVRATGRYGPESLHFSCAVDLRDGGVRSVDINTRQR